MQCPKCGSINPETREQCNRCGTTLLVKMPPASVPDWRKEVTRKVKAYGDRKRSLTTPPGPLKDKNVAIEELPDPEALIETTGPVVEEPVRPVEIQRPSLFEKKPRERKLVSPPAPPLLPPEPERPPAQTVDELDIWNDDLISEEVVPQDTEPPELRGLKEASRRLLAEPDSETTQVKSSHFWRRTAALVIDMIVLIGSYTVLVYAYAALIQDDVKGVLRAAWPAVAELFLLVHFLYYLYFYSTSRQTPGQVFFSIELHDAGGREVPFHKILVRWLSMVLFNVLNLLPLLFGKKQLLMDQISGTEIRSLK
jgi:uncharacterized RDD family membrane protein YckC